MDLLVTIMPIENIIFITFRQRTRTPAMHAHTIVAVIWLLSLANAQCVFSMLVWSGWCQVVDWQRISLFSYMHTARDSGLFTSIHRRDLVCTFVHVSVSIHLLFLLDSNYLNLLLNLNCIDVIVTRQHSIQSLIVFLSRISFPEWAIFDHLRYTVWTFLTSMTMTRTLRAWIRTYTSCSFLPWTLAFRIKTFEGRNRKRRRRAMVSIVSKHNNKLQLVDFVMSINEPDSWI